MSNEQTNTELAAILPVNWKPRFIAALYEKQYVLPYVLNATGDHDDHGGKGAVAHITVGASLTVNDTGSDGSLTVQTNTPTDISLTIDKYKDCTVEVVGKTREQVFDVFENTFPGQAGDALRQKMEADLLALYSDSTATAAGDGLGNLGEDELLASIQTLISAKIPVIQKPDECFFALADTQFAPIRKGGFLDYRRTGEAGGGAAEIEVPKLWNIPVVFSTQVVTSASIRYSLLAHQSALAWAAQRNVVPRMADRLASAKDSWLMTVMGLYGVKTVAAARFVQLKSKA